MEPYQVVVWDGLSLVTIAVAVIIVVVSLVLMATFKLWWPIVERLIVKK